LLVWLGHHRSIKPPGLFALYVTGYSAFRIFEESLRVDPSEHFLGLRFNLYVAAILTVAGAVWFWYTQRRRPATAPPAGLAGEPPGGEADVAAQVGADAADPAPGAAGDGTRPGD
jgi:prolipoprotein diacylglyceryltransferase